MLLERSFIAIEQGNSSFILGILDFILGILVFWGLGGVFYGILEFPCVIASEAKQSHSKFRLKSPSLRGFEEAEAISRNSSFYFRNSSFLGVRGFLLSKI